MFYLRCIMHTAIFTASSAYNSIILRSLNADLGLFFYCATNSEQCCVLSRCRHQRPGEVAITWMCPLPATWYRQGATNMEVVPGAETFPTTTTEAVRLNCTKSLRTLEVPLADIHPYPYTLTWETGERLNGLDILQVFWSSSRCYGHVDKSNRRMAR